MKKRRKRKAFSKNNMSVYNLEGSFGKLVFNEVVGNIIYLNSGLALVTTPSSASNIKREQNLRDIYIFLKFLKNECKSDFNFVRSYLQFINKVIFLVLLDL